MTPSLPQVHSYLTTGPEPLEQDVLRRVIKPAIFSFNHVNLDDSYPKRLWRLSKNITLRYHQRYWAHCYELKDCLLDYLNNHYKFSKDSNNLSWNPRMQEGESFGEEQFLKRMKYNYKEFNKLTD